MNEFTIEELQALVRFTKKTIKELNTVKHDYYLKSLHHFEVFMEAQKLNKVISRIQNLEHSYKLFF